MPNKVLICSCVHPISCWLLLSLLSFDYVSKAYVIIVRLVCFVTSSSEIVILYHQRLVMQEIGHCWLNHRGQFDRESLWKRFDDSGVKLSLQNPLTIRGETQFCVYKCLGATRMIACANETGANFGQKRKLCWPWKCSKQKNKLIQNTIMNGIVIVFISYTANYRFIAIVKVQPFQSNFDVCVRVSCWLLWFFVSVSIRWRTACSIYHIVPHSAHIQLDWSCRKYFAVINTRKKSHSN